MVQIIEHNCQEQPSSTPTLISKRILYMLRVVYHMLRNGISKPKFMMDLHLLLKRGKIAGKVITNLMTFHHHHLPHHHHHHHANTSHVASMYSAFSCHSMDPNLSIYQPKEVEFSCSNTPTYTPFHSTKRKNRHHKDSYDHDAEAISKAFEILNFEALDVDCNSIVASPSPARLWTFGKSPKGKQLRITDSPFPLKEEEADDGTVDRKAEEFIMRFHEQLRRQQLMPATPEYCYVVRRE